MVSDIDKYKEECGLIDYDILKSTFMDYKLCVRHNSNPTIWSYMKMASYNDILELKNSCVFLIDKNYTSGKVVEQFDNLEELCRYILTKKLAGI